MNWKETILVFSPPPWPVFLPAAAGALLLFEVALLLWRMWRGRSVAAAIGMTIALAGGPVTALAAAVFAAGGAGSGSGDGAAGHAMGGPAPKRRTMATSALWFTFLAALAGATARWPLAGSVLAITACAAVWAARAYRRTTSDLARRSKAGLMLLRMAAILVLGLWALGPQLEYPTQKKVRRTLLIGVDLSSSMQVRDVPGERPAGGAAGRPVSRIDAVQAALDDSAGDLERVAKEADVRVIGFSAGPQPLADLGDPAVQGAAGGDQSFSVKLPPATGGATAIGDAAMSAADAILKQGSELAGIVLISDGCNNTSQTITPEKFASRMAMLAVSIYAVGAGSDQVSPSTRGLSVEELVAPDQVEAFNRLPIRAAVEALGLQGRTIRVSCRFGNESNSPAGGAAAAEANDAQVFAVKDSRQSFSAQFVRVPLASGFHRLTVQVECLNPPEGLSGQFSSDKLVQVVDRGLRILYLEGVYRYEVKFLTQALAAAGRFTVDRRIMLQPLRADQPGPLGENLEDWLRYHAVILGDLPSDYLTPKQQQIIKDLVGTYGKGLCMIGGSRSFGRGGWQRTPLADAMPVDLAASTEQIEHEIHVAPTPAGLADPMLAIGKDAPGASQPQSGASVAADPASAWAELSVLPGANKLAGVKPGATVLATTGDADKFPLIVAERYGAGRSLAVAFDTTWLWVTTKDTGEMQRRFWRQVALYLCDPKGNVWVTTDKARYELPRLVSGTETVEVAAGVEAPQGSPMPQAPVKLTLTAPGGKAMPLQLATEDHRRVARLSGVQLPAPGTYSLKLEAEVAGKPLSAEHRFDVKERNLEALDVLANFKLLQRLSDETKGRFVTLAGFRDLLARLGEGAAAPRIVRQIEHFDLGGYLRWPVIVAIVSLLCLEWALRKRRGLV
jgi:uncharacterized membrane protein